MSKFYEDYADFVTKLASTCSLETFEAKITLGSLGLAGEAGEVADIAKKVLFHGMVFDEEVKRKMVLEVSDVMWYVVFLCRHVLGVSLEEVIARNKEKLSERYKKLTFTTEEFMVKEREKGN